MRWVLPLAPEVDEPPEVVGGKAHGLILLYRLGLPVPPGFVIRTEACRAFLATGRLPDGLDREIAAAVTALEAATGRHLGDPERPLAVSVRSGAAVSMPGMMTTVLNVGLPGGRRPDAMRELAGAIAEVMSSWETPRARTYREIHAVPHELGTAVVVQAMVFGNHDEHSGSGVAFSRNPHTGAPEPFGEVAFGAAGEAVVSGTSLTRALSELAGLEPDVWSGLVAALTAVERHYRDACYLEFTFEAGELWLLQVRPAGFSGLAAIRVVIDLVAEGLLDRRRALLRISGEDLSRAVSPRLEAAADYVFARGTGACPGVVSGRVATTADAAVRMSADGPVILVRPATSPLDLHGLAASAGMVTALGGPASHAAVVARSMGKPAVVGTAGLAVEPAAGSVRAGGRTVHEGDVLSIDGTTGEVVVGEATVVPGGADPCIQTLLGWVADIVGDVDGTHGQRLSAARDRIRGAGAWVDRAFSRIEALTAPPHGIPPAADRRKVPPAGFEPAAFRSGGERSIP